MAVRTIANKIKAAFEHGKMDFYAGFPRDPRKPLIVYPDLTEAEQALVMSAWVDGWDNEALMQSLPAGSPA